MRKSPLYRKVNTKARGVRHRFGGDYRHERKADLASEALHSSMHGKKHRGLDYTPLFRFLISKVGSEWNAVFSEAVSRLDRSEPISWLVALHEHDKKDCVLLGETSYFSGLYVDADGKLRKVNPELGPEHITPHCTCCTYTLDGIRIS